MRTLSKKAKKNKNKKLPNKGWGFYIQKTDRGYFYPDQLCLICLRRYRRGNTFFFDFKVLKGTRPEEDPDVKWWVTSEDTSYKEKVSLAAYCKWLREGYIRRLTEQETAMLLLGGDPNIHGK
jgi:hypothetical protein